MATDTLTLLAGIFLGLRFIEIPGLSAGYGRLAESGSGMRRQRVMLALVPSTIHCLSSFVWRSLVQCFRRHPESKPADDRYSFLIEFEERMRERPWRGSGRAGEYPVLGESG